MFLVSKSGPFYNQNPFISEKLSSKNCVFRTKYFSCKNGNIISENGRSLTLLIFNLWHFLHHKITFYAKVLFGVKYTITKELVKLETCCFHYIS